MKELIERLRKGVVTSAPYEPQYTVPPAAICFEAADEIERLLAEEKMQLEQIVNQGLEIERLTEEVKDQRDEILAGDQDIERLTNELATSRYWREQEVKDLTDNLAKAKEYHANELADVTAELAEMKAERDSLSVAAALWNKRYIEACQQHNDRQTNLGHQIVALEAERDALAADAARYRWLKSGCENSMIGVWNCLDEQNRRIWLAESELDDAIDAAVQGAGK